MSMHVKLPKSVIIDKLRLGTCYLPILHHCQFSIIFFSHGYLFEMNFTAVSCQLFVIVFNWGEINLVEAEIIIAVLLNI